METSNELYFYSTANLFFTDNTRMNEIIDSNSIGMDLFKTTFTSFTDNIMLHDRSGVITTPIKSVTIPGLELPTLAKIDKSFEQICYERAAELIERAETNNRKLLLMYSGGIDSTLILTSLMKTCNYKKLKDNVVVLMNNTSINENQNFYENYVIKRCTISHSQFFNRYIGDDRYLMVTGECNDQLWGSQVVSDNVSIFGNTPWDSPMDSNIIIQWLNTKMPQAQSEQVFDILNSICNASPVAIDTVYKWFWWLNFTCKWQNVFMRAASFASSDNRNKLRPFSNYDAFYATPDFQLWSMNNSNQLITKGWANAKSACKDIIYDFNHDAYYRDNKEKQGSLYNVFRKKQSTACIASDWSWHDTWDNDNWLNPNNSFN